MQSAECVCADGNAVPACRRQRDPCGSSPCLNNATCVSKGNDYVCRWGRSRSLPPLSSWWLRWPLTLRGDTVLYIKSIPSMWCRPNLHWTPHASLLVHTCLYYVLDRRDNKWRRKLKPEIIWLLLNLKLELEISNFVVQGVFKTKKENTIKSIIWTRNFHSSG